MKLSAIIAPLIAAKASHGTIMEIVLAFEAEQADALEKRRESDRLRQAKARTSRDSRDPSTKSRDRSLTGGDARVVDNFLERATEPKESKKESKAPVGALSKVLDVERAQAVVDHRQRLRKPLTEHAATLLAGKFAKCPDPNIAADAMISNGWQGFEPGWLESRQTHGPPVAVKGAGLFFQAADMIDEHNRSNGGEQGDRADAGGVPVLALVDQRRHGKGISVLGRGLFC